MMEAAFTFRNTHSGTYGLDLERAATMPWPAQTGLIDDAVYLFEECARTASDAVAESDIRDVLEGLATIVCEMYKLHLQVIRNLQPHKVIDIQEAFTTTRRNLWSVLG